ncbi:MAG: hypothetical protein HY719_10350, partial [Planctomycetes bacterium]|nr:hypothetical protein [Planctomycetota bacterium]
MTSRVRLGGILSAFGLALAAGWSWSEARAGEEFIATGARHQAMGGTGVAAARGADALAWNPALLPRFMEVEGASSEAPEKETPEEAARREAKLDEAATQAADEWPLVESSSWNAELVTVEAMVSDQGDAINQVKLVADKLESTTGKFNNIQSSLNNPTAATSANLQTAVKDLLDTVEDVVKLDQPGVGLYESLHLGAVGV